VRANKALRNATLIATVATALLLGGAQGAVASSPRNAVASNIQAGFASLDSCGLDCIPPLPCLDCWYYYATYDSGPICDEVGAEKALEVESLREVGATTLTLNVFCGTPSLYVSNPPTSADLYIQYS
jgi:hypothetical protein